jgi:hypothetical protein
MVGGTVVGVIQNPDSVRLVVQGNGHDRHIEVVRDIYRTPCALAVRVDDQVWWQCSAVYWTPSGFYDVDTHGAKADTPLVMIRQNDGDPAPWPWGEAARMAGVKQCW